ncbi:hypothetical protein H257_12480 [Aphanomyces astaci]|uniref:Uncharacterized protein n=1 Tax=Aphanomyces astaci TaxID=112090 RepID=W4FZ94_APHAT|nr:hypothetical protein H257_12480 [Aphanomyces astaci]ETV72316.1 hypothetical protein H257_12480 [Aphanomyces astaci]|eukprot:XP_009837998.1 hypothetical protein H257_12480 [Aphanomyces astaci]
MALPSFLFASSILKASSTGSSMISITDDVVSNVRRFRRRISSGDQRDTVPATPPPYPTRHQF